MKLVSFYSISIHATHVLNYSYCHLLHLVWFVLYFYFCFIFCVFLENKYGRDTLIIAADFSAGGVQFYEGIAEQLRDLDIAVLGK